MAPPAAQRAAHRPAQLRSLKQQRSTTLRGYRFRTVLDRLLVRAERLLMIVVVVFFGYWLYDGYGRDWWHARLNAAPVQVDWDYIPQGASAAEIEVAFGGHLPSSPASNIAPMSQPDYMVPAYQLELPPIPTAIPADPRPVRMIVPAMEVDSPVAEVFLRDGVWEVADYAVGYHHGTAPPGSGNTVLAGHAGFRGGVFARLPQLRIGDDVYLETSSIRYHYQVDGIQSVWPNQVEVMYPTADPILTMITCTAWDTQRLVVTARLIDQATLGASVEGGEPRGSS